MSKIIIVNGPNLNLVGSRESNIYGATSLNNYLDNLSKELPVDHYQTNIEGEIIDQIQKAKLNGYSAIILNAGGYTHTSVAIRDAILAVDTPVVEVHISNIFSREDFRNKSLIAGVCVGHISGFGLKSYDLAIHYFLQQK